MKNKHAKEIMMYAEDWLETNKPWERWRFRIPGGEWKDFTRSHPTWSEIHEYRRKPKTITINGFDIPEPMRESPINGTIYWVVDFYSDKGAEDFKWNDDAFDFKMLAKSICHSTEEAAKLHAKALLSFTKKD